MRITNYQPGYSINSAKYKNKTMNKQSFGILSVNPTMLREVTTSQSDEFGQQIAEFSKKIANNTIPESLENAIKSSKVLQALGEKYDVLATVIRHPESIKTIQNIRWFDILKLEFTDKSKNLKVYNLDQRLEVGLKDAQNWVEKGEPDLTDITSEDLRNIHYKSYEPQYNKEIYKILCQKGLKKSEKNNFYEDVLKDSISKLNQKEIEKEIA